jgi:hypothetical protein
MWGLLGDIRIGEDAWVGPTRLSETRKGPFPQHEVARGKKPVQDVGDDNDERSMSFFWDEIWCDPLEEARKTIAAFDARDVLGWVGGDGTFDGTYWLITELQMDTQRTTASGRPTRIACEMKLLERPVPDPLSLLITTAKATALALVPWASTNPEGRK